MDAADRGRLRALGLTWALISALMLALAWPAIIGQRFVDADDMMRLLEVRDWLAGQSWWDVSQHRIGPSGLAMHWSRLVDLPLALIESPLLPLVGRHAAEGVAVAVVPLMTLAAAMAALTLVLRRLFGAGTAVAVLGSALMVCAPSVYVQIHPVRIDHHGWQIVFAALAVACLLDSRPARSGWLAGLAMAVSLNISLEQLPFAAAIGALLGLLWAFGREAPERLTGYLWGLALGTAGLLLVVAPVGRWSMPWCDAILPQHALGLAVAAAGAWGATRAGGRWPARLALLGLAGAAAGAVFALAAPRCLAGPFGAMGPLSHDLWLANVSEGLPVWRQDAIDIPTIIGFPVIGLAGAGLAWRRAATAEDRRRWLAVLVLLGVATGLALVLRRAGGTANLLAVAGALALIEPVRQRLDASASAVTRVIGSAFAIFACSPLFPVYLAALVFPASADATPPVPRTAESCDTACGLAALSSLPPALFFTSIDLGPRLVLVTPHRAWTGAYHRSGAPMEHTLAAFTGAPDAAARLVVGSGARYLLIAPDSGEARVYAAAAPHGLMAQLVAGRTPSWLEPLPTRTHDLSLYRVRPDTGRGG